MAEAESQAKAAAGDEDKMTEIVNTDICIIGAGSGGLSVAAGAVQMGADVVLLNARIWAAIA